MYPCPGLTASCGCVTKANANVSNCLFVDDDAAAMTIKTMRGNTLIIVREKEYA